MGARSQGDFSNLVTASSSAGAAPVSFGAVCANAAEQATASAAQDAATRTTTAFFRPTLSPASRILRRLTGSVPLLPRLTRSLISKAAGSLCETLGVLRLGVWRSGSALAKDRGTQPAARVKPGSRRKWRTSQHLADIRLFGGKHGAQIRRAWLAPLCRLRQAVIRMRQPRLETAGADYRRLRLGDFVR